MKSFLQFSCYRLDWFYRKVIVILIIIGSHLHSSAQCGAGYTRDTINWDYLDFFHRSGAYGASNPITGIPFVTNAMAQTQYFGVAGNRVTFSNTNSLPVGQNGAFYADVTNHTGENGSFGSGEDLMFMPAQYGTYSMTLTFQNAVQDLKFSLYDVDYSQRVTVTALNGSTACNINMSKIWGSLLTITGNGTTSATCKAGTTTPITDTSTQATVNVTIGGYITSVTITISETDIKTSGSADTREDGHFYLSDISACFANPAFPTNYYYNYTQPFTNQPAYFLTNPQNLIVYMVNASTGVADMVFSDPGTDGQKMNSLAYDPINKWLYYVMDNYTLPYTSQPPENRKLKKYDFNTGTISTVIPDLRSFGIPTLIQGVEFAGAAFYNGSLFLGIEGSDGNLNSTGAESVVWKIDFDGSGSATSYTQVFALPGDNGSGLRRHDWGDLIIKDGILISHATYEAAAGTSTNIYTHYNLQTGTATTYSGDNSVSGQLGQTYNGTIYRVKNNIAIYNNNGTVGATTPITLTSCSPAWVNDAGDASDPFKPKCDFGDAPSSYDPVALSPAANQKACNNSTLRIGSAWGDEWSKISSTDASGDDEEDGINTVTLMVSNGVAYNHAQDVTVLNNTGSPAYLAGWLDYNANGIFESSEGTVLSISSSALPQTVTLSWMGITIAPGTPNSFLRVRLYSGTLTTNDATGWFSDGETEDYPVLSQSMPLGIQLIDFSASVTNEQDVLLTWNAYTDNNSLGFEIHRSIDKINWEKIGWAELNHITLSHEYNFKDLGRQGTTYYRLKMVEKSGSSKYSSVQKVELSRNLTGLRIFPNPAQNKFTAAYLSATNQTGMIFLKTLSGVTVVKNSISLQKGDNRLHIPVRDLPNGIYIIELITSERSLFNKITVAN